MINFDENSVIERIRELRLRHFGGRGKSSFAKSIGISPSTYSYYEKDRLPPIDVLLRICDLTGTDIYSLLTGKKRSDECKSGQNEGVINRINEILSKYPHTKESITAFCDMLESINTIGGEEVKESKTEGLDSGWIPVLGRTAAGLTSFWSETQISDSARVVTELKEVVEKYIHKPIESTQEGFLEVDLKIRELMKGVKDSQVSVIEVNEEQDNSPMAQFLDCRSLREAFPDCFALKIDGNSMSPRINDGNYVILSPSVPAINGSISVIKLKGQIGVTCKIIRKDTDKVHLIPVNEHYETGIFDLCELEWSLAVLCHLEAGG